MSRFLLALIAAAPLLPAQIFQFTREQLIEYTPKNPYERSADGRPKVPDALLKKFDAMSAEEVWTILDRIPGYKNQYEGHWHILHPEKKLIGRAFTAQFMPPARRCQRRGRSQSQ